MKYILASNISTVVLGISGLIFSNTVLAIAPATINPAVINVQSTQKNNALMQERQNQNKVLEIKQSSEDEQSTKAVQPSSEKSAQMELNKDNISTTDSADIK